MSIDATTRKSDPSTTTEDGIVAIATTAGEKENKSEPPASGIAAMAADAALNRNENKKAEMDQRQPVSSQRSPRPRLRRLASWVPGEAETLEPTSKHFPVQLS